MENEEKIGKTFSVLSNLIEDARMDRRAIIEKAQWWIDEIAIFKFSDNDYTVIDTSSFLQLNIESAGRMGQIMRLSQI